MFQTGDVNIPNRFILALWTVDATLPFDFCSPKNEEVAMLELRKHASWYLKGLKGGGRVLNMLNRQNQGCDAKHYYEFVSHL